MNLRGTYKREGNYERKEITRRKEEFMRENTFEEGGQILGVMDKLLKVKFYEDIYRCMWGMSL